MNDKVVVGQVISAHGIQGQFKIKSFTTDPDDLFTYNQLFIDEMYDGIFLKKVRSLKEYFIVSCSEIDSRNKVCLLYTSPSPRDLSTSRMPSSA